MSWRVLPPLLWLSALAACSAPSRQPAASAKDSVAPAPVSTAAQAPAVLLIGTSLTAGLGLDPAVAWPALLQHRVDSAGYHFRVINAGVSGETSGDALHRIDWLTSQGIPSVVVVETGANDALRGQSPDSVRANLDAILTRLEALQPRPVLVVAAMEALPNMGRDYAARFRAVFPAAARAHHAVYLPFLLTGVAGIDSLNQADGIHPNVAGSRIVAANVWRTLRPILDSLSHTTPAR
jgi:acyl-CoA thioesterase-1